MMFCCLVITCLLAATTGSEFTHFERIMKANHDKTFRPIIDSLTRARQSDPCRIQHLVGRTAGYMPNSAQRILIDVQKHAKDAAKGDMRKILPGPKMTACKEALKNSKDKKLNRKICGEALAHYRAFMKENAGRSSGSAWDELIGDISETMTTEDILFGLDLWSQASLGLLVDNTGSMANDIAQVKASFNLSHQFH